MTCCPEVRLCNSHLLCKLFQDNYPSYPGVYTTDGNYIRENMFVCLFVCPETMNVIPIMATGVNIELFGTLPLLSIVLALQRPIQAGVRMEVQIFAW